MSKETEDAGGIVAEIKVEAHNNAIDKAISIFEKECSTWGISFQANPNRKFFESFYQDIISKLQSLKK